MAVLISPSAVWLAAALCLVCLATCSSMSMAQNNCNNPLFTSTSSPAIKEAMLTVPAPSPSGFSSVCPNIQSGADSCCTDASIAAFRSTFEGIRGNIQTTSDELAQQLNLFEKQRREFDSSALNELFQALQQQNPNLTRQEFDNAINNFLSALNTLLRNLSSNYGSCLGGILNYLAGMYCTACDPNWNNVVTNTSPLTIKLQSNTCSQLQNSCRPLLSAINSFMEPLQEFFKVIIGENLDISGDGVCGSAGCDSFICESMVSGVSTDIPLNFGDSQSQSSSSAITATMMQRVPNILATAPSRAVSFLLDLVSRRHHSLMGTPKVVVQSTTTTVYAEDGYDAVSVGSSTSSEVFDRSTSSFTANLPSGDSSSSGLSTGAIVGIVIGCVVGVALIVVAVLLGIHIHNKKQQKRKNGSAVSSSSRVVPDSSASPEQQQEKKMFAANP